MDVDRNFERASSERESQEKSKSSSEPSKRRSETKPKDGTLQQEAPEPEANWFGPAQEPQEEFIDDGIWSKSRKPTQERDGKNSRSSSPPSKTPVTSRN